MAELSASRGDLVRIFTNDATDKILKVCTPSGLKIEFPPARSNRVWVPQIGTWTYHWGGDDDDDDEGTIEVVMEFKPDVLSNPTDLPPMIASKRPRR